MIYSSAGKFVQQSAMVFLISVMTVLIWAFIGRTTCLLKICCLWFQDFQNPWHYVKTTSVIELQRPTGNQELLFLPNPSFTLAACSLKSWYNFSPYGPSYNQVGLTLLGYDQEDIPKQLQELLISKLRSWEMIMHQQKMKDFKRQLKWGSFIILVLVS